MSRPETPITEVRHNFKPVNDYIDHVLDRQHDLLSYRRFKRFRVLLVGISAVILSGALAYVLYSFGVYLQEREPPLEVVVKNLDIPPIDSSYPDEAGARVTLNFTLFQEVETSETSKVVTGFNYDPEEITYPKDQYCYVSVDAGGPKRDTYYVARKAGKNGTNWETGVPAEIFRLGQNHCRFIL
jgi:hypothetical protein